MLRHSVVPSLLAVFAQRPGVRTLAAAVTLGLFAVGQPGPAAAANWFWKAVPAAKDDGSRFAALQVVAEARADGKRVYGSRKNAARVLTRWRDEIEAAARASKVSEALIAAVVMVESGGNPRAVSPAGAQGLGQLMPGTARRYGVRDSFKPADNLRGAALYLSDLIEMFRGDLVLALAAYNAGENAVLRFNGVPPYSETRAYVPKVLGAFQVVGAFCKTAPRSARRQCKLPRQIN
ncbi:MAG: transglycosylase SLT domain-containing protein [Pseudomonadota bacterium]